MGQQISIGNPEFRVYYYDENNNVLEVHKQKPKSYIRIEILESKLPDLNKVTSVYDVKKNEFINTIKPKI